MSVNDEAEQTNQYRLAQESQLIRFLEENGIDLPTYVADPSILDLSPILDADGRIIPESDTADPVPPSTAKRIVRVPSRDTEPGPPRRIVRTSGFWDNWRREQEKRARERSGIGHQLGVLQTEGDRSAYQQGVSVGEKLGSLGLRANIKSDGSKVLIPSGAAEELRAMPEAQAVLKPHLEEPPDEAIAGHWANEEGRWSWVDPTPGGYRLPMTPFTRGIVDGAQRSAYERRMSMWRKVTGQEEE